MSTAAIGICRCPLCQQAAPHPDQERHRQMNLFLSRLDEAQRRWYVALEAERLGPGGDRQLAQITGLDEQTIRRGRAELAAGLADVPVDRVRRPGGGRPPVEKKTPRS
jgi:hypothetical protein